jgi:hypothetical protein
MMPAGIEDGIEVYKVENRVRAMMEGIRIEYSNLPDRIRSIFRKELYSDKKVIDNLRLMGITEPEEMEKTYVGCRYGAMDGTPDMKGVQTKSDAPSCKELSKCPGYGSVCRIPENLTRQEYQVAVFI